MTGGDMIEALRVLRDEVLETAEHGDRDPPGSEVFEAVIRSLAVGGDSVAGLDVTLRDAIARRLAWGDSEEVVLADAETVFDRLMVAIERAFRNPADRIVVIELATLVATSVARVVALEALARASRDRAARLREEVTHQQLREVLDKQKAAIRRLEGR